MGVVTKEKQLENVLNELYKISENFLVKKYPSGKSSCLFNRRSEGRKIILSLVGLIESTQFNLSFPSLSFDDENAFLKATNKMHQNILHRMKDDQLLKEFYPAFYRKFKTIIGLFFSDNLNLCYLEYYILCREKYTNVPSNYTILKMETVSTFKAQLKLCEDKETRKILLAAMDTIQNDSRGVNFYANNSEQRFVNLLKFLDTMRLVLADRREQVVFPVVTNLIERGLGIVRSDFVSGCMVKGYDYIAGEIEVLEKKKVVGKKAFSVRG